MNQSDVKHLPPKLSETAEQARLVRGLGLILGVLSRFNLGGEKVKSLASDCRSINNQMNAIVNVSENFNQIFKIKGWILSESTNIEIAKQALTLAENGQLQAAEELLASDYMGDKLSFLVMRLNGVQVFRKRRHLLEEAMKLSMAERYHSAIPLILTIVDGVGQDYFNKSIFSEGVNLEELNAIAGNGALAQLTREMARTRRAFNEEEICFPYRNGILHGRDINYGNKLVAAKAWSHLSCVADVIRAREAVQDVQSKPDEPLLDVLKRYQKTLLEVEQVESWLPRPSFRSTWRLSAQSSDEISPGSPEETLRLFLKAWASQNYGEVGRITVYFDNRPINKRAGQIRSYLNGLNLKDAAIIEINDEAAAITNIKCELVFENEDTEQKKDFDFRLVYGDEESSPKMRGLGGGSWKVIPYYQSITLG